MSEHSYYEFEVTLLDIKPRIWRRFLLRTDSSFADLHRAIQDAMGWYDSHLWAFMGSGRDMEPIAGVPEEEFGDEGETPDARKVKLVSFFGQGEGAKKCLYLYDFGDDWRHQVELKGIEDFDKKFKRRLLAGKRACPMEDCGSTPGYERMVEFLKTGKDPYGDGDEELREWMGDWDPDAFDLDDAKKDFDR